MHHNHEGVQSPLAPLQPIDVNRLNVLLAKCRSARPLTHGEKADTAEAFAPMTAEVIANKATIAFDAGAAAYRKGSETTHNPYSSDDRLLEREAWYEGFEHARSGFETDA